MECLIRQHPHKQNSEKQIDKVVTPVVGKNAVYLDPCSYISSATKRKLGAEVPEVSMERRLENLKSNEGSIPRSNNMIHLLMQGMKSKDEKLIKTVLLKKDKQIIRNTLRKLPIIGIYDLLEHLGKYVTGNSITE